jgi:undecaprenyl-diphosphatase
LLKNLGYTIKDWDIDVFHKINHDWTSPILDAILPVLRESIVWVPLYAFLILFGYINFGKNAWYWALAAIASTIVSNYVSSDLIKPYYGRLRPCMDGMLEPAARLLLGRCPSSGSFTSSHATNHFAVAAFLFFTLKHVAKWSVYFFIWAACICYAQVYVGVHFPIDVIFGGVLGISIGYFIASLFNYKNGLLTPSVKQHKLW